MFLDALFTITRTWNKPRWLSTDEWIMKNGTSAQWICSDVMKNENLKKMGWCGNYIKWDVPGLDKQCHLFSHMLTLASNFCIYVCLGGDIGHETKRNIMGKLMKGKSMYQNAIIPIMKLCVLISKRKWLVWDPCTFVYLFLFFYLGYGLTM